MSATATSSGSCLSPIRRSSASTPSRAPSSSSRWSSRPWPPSSTAPFASSAAVSAWPWKSTTFCPATPTGFSAPSVSTTQTARTHQLQRLRRNGTPLPSNPRTTTPLPGTSVVPGFRKNGCAPFMPRPLRHEWDIVTACIPLSELRQHARSAASSANSAKPSPPSPRAATPHP